MRARTALVLVAVLLLPAACGVSGEITATDGGSTTGPTGSTTSTTPGDGSTDVDADAVLHEAVDRTLGLDRFSATSVAELTAGSKRIVLEFDGRADYVDVIADLDLAVGDPDGDRRVRILADGDTVWVAPETDDVTVPGGRTWLAGPIDLFDDRNFGPEGLLGTILLLRASNGAIVEDEDAEVDGVGAREYAVTVTYDDAVDAAGDDADTFRTALDLTYPEPVALDVRAWVDDDGVLRRLRVEIDPDDDTPLSGTYDLDLEPLDEVAAPEPPDPSDVATGPEALALLERLTGN